MLKYAVVLLWLFPALTFAQTSQTGSLQSLLVGIGGFLNSIVIPFILAIAFIVFVVNVVRFFILGGASDEGQKNAKNLALYGIGAFVFILSFWGIVNMLIDGVGLEVDPCTMYTESDYISRPGSPCTRSSDTPPTVGGDISLPTPAPGADDSGLIIGGLDTPPSPTAPTPPTSFTPDGLPIVEGLTDAQRAQALAQSAENAIRVSAADYFATDMTIDFGHNTDLIKNTLMADLHTTKSAAVSDTERVRAAARLVALGAITEEQFSNYTRNLNAYYTELRQTDRLIDSNTTANLATPLPNTLTQNSNMTRTQLIDTLTPLTSPQQAQALAAEVYDTTADPDTRYDRILDLYLSGGNHLAYLNPSTHGELLTRFTSDVNAEKMYSADFNMVQ